MTNRNEKQLVREIDKLNEKEKLAVTYYISELLSARLSKTNTSTDDLIAALAERRENQRARQVIEWERLRRKNIQKSA